MLAEGNMKKYYLSFLLPFIITNIFAEIITVSGKVVDDNNNPIYEYPPGRVYYPEDERKTNSNIPSVLSQSSRNSNDTHSNSVRNVNK